MALYLEINICIGYKKLLKSLGSIYLLLIVSITNFYITQSTPKYNDLKQDTVILFTDLYVPA